MIQEEIDRIKSSRDEKINLNDKKKLVSSFEKKNNELKKSPISVLSQST